MAIHQIDNKALRRGAATTEKRGALFIVGIGALLLVLLGAVAVLASRNFGAATSCLTEDDTTLNLVLLVSGLLGFVVAPSVQVALNDGPRAKVASLIMASVTLVLYLAVWGLANPCVAQLVGR